ncbi:MAG TPA: hypothetical protein VIG51_07330 [Candidatus Baltobacteraceae bacterium]|jgi:hypothetical protein
MNERDKKTGHPSDYGSRTLDEPMHTGDGDPLEERGYLRKDKPAPPAAGQKLGEDSNDADLQP